MWLYHNKIIFCVNKVVNGDQVADGRVEEVAVSGGRRRQIKLQKTNDSWFCILHSSDKRGRFYFKENAHEYQNITEISECQDISKI
jgi:hypothetical protein